MKRRIAASMTTLLWALFAHIPRDVAAALRLAADRVVLDGEVVALDEEGSFF